VTDGVLAALYRRCELFVFPSLSEGFGLPPAEAAACGAPVLASAATSIPEAVPVADVLFDPADAHALADRITALLSSWAQRDRLRRTCRDAVRSHTWEAVGRRAALAIGAMAGSGRLALPPPAEDPLSALVPAPARERMNRRAAAG
jgi:glycosyltransferase involved in cell wall biosynthesis